MDDKMGGIHAQKEIDRVGSQIRSYVLRPYRLASTTNRPQVSNVDASWMRSRSVHGCPAAAMAGDPSAKPVAKLRKTTLMSRAPNVECWAESRACERPEDSPRRPQVERRRAKRAERGAAAPESASALSLTLSRFRGRGNRTVPGRPMLDFHAGQLFGVLETRDSSPVVP